MLAELLPSQDFGALTWHLGPLRNTSSEHNFTAYWTVRNSHVEALPVRFAEPAKTWSILNGGSASRIHQRGHAARWLWSGICQRLGRDAATLFTWDDLRPEDLRATEQLLREAGVKPTTLDGTMGTVLNLVSVLSAEGVAPSVSYGFRASSDRNQSASDLQDLDSIPAGLVSEAALDALSDIYRRAEHHVDIVWSSVMAILFASGLRLNEVLSLPLKCLVEEEMSFRDPTGEVFSRTQVYLRYYKSKSKHENGEGRRSLERLPLTDAQAELVRMAVDRLKAECAAGRAVAKRLERSHERWCWPLSARPEYVGSEEARLLIGDNRGAIASLLSKARRKHQEAVSVDPRNNSWLRMTIDAFEDYMTNRQKWDALWTVKPYSGRPGQRASESLICLLESSTRLDAVQIPIVWAPSINAPTNWLVGSKTEGFPSVFERFERTYGLVYRESNGQSIRFTPHACRRLFVTNAFKAGATPVDVARWQGREHMGDLSTYDRRTMPERVDALRSAIRMRWGAGQVVQAYWRVAESEREAFLQAAVRAVHVTPYGFCVHDFSSSPCRLALNCVKNCPDFVCDHSSQETHAQLVTLRRRTQEVVQSMASADLVTENWLREQNQTLSGIDAILAQMDLVKSASHTSESRSTNSRRRRK